METAVQHRGGPLSRNGALVRAVALFPLMRYFKGVAGFQKILTRNGIAAGSKYDQYEMIRLRDFLSVLEDAARFAREPVLGAKLGLTVSPGELGPAGLLMMQSATLRRGLASYAKSISALQSATEMRLVE